MSALLAGDQALRGRAALDLRVGAFRFRDAAAYWGCAPETRAGFSMELVKAAPANGVRLVDLPAMYGQRPTEDPREPP